MPSPLIVIAALLAVALVSPAHAMQRAKQPPTFFELLGQLFQQPQKVALPVRPKVKVVLADPIDAGLAADIKAAALELAARQGIEQMESELPKFHTVKRNGQISLVHGPSAEDVEEYVKRKRFLALAAACRQLGRGARCVQWP